MVIVGYWPDVVVFNRSVDVGIAVSVEMTVTVGSFGINVVEENVAVVEVVLAEGVVEDVDSVDSAVCVNVVSAIFVVVDSVVKGDFSVVISISIESDVESVKTASDVDVRKSKVVDGSFVLWVVGDVAKSVVDCDSSGIVDDFASFVDVIMSTVSVVDVEDKVLVNGSEVFAVVTDGNSDGVIVESVFVEVE